MTDSSARARAPARFTAAVHRGLRECAFIALGVIAIVVFAALATYNPQDPAYTTSGDSSVVHNRVGPVGAWLADVLFFLFGRPAYLLPAGARACLLGGDAQSRQG